MPFYSINCALYINKFTHDFRMIIPLLLVLPQSASKPNTIMQFYPYLEIPLDLCDVATFQVLKVCIYFTCIVAKGLGKGKWGHSQLVCA